MIWLYFNYLSTIAKKGKLTLLCSPDEKSGRFLLDEIEIAGNFVKWDERIHRGERSVGWVVGILGRLATFFSISPSKVLWAPVWKAWHWCWRKTV